MLPLDQVDVFGAYVSPLVLMMVAVALVWLMLRQLIDALGLIPYIWHPALFFTAVYVILVSLIGLRIGGIGVWAL